AASLAHVLWAVHRSRVFFPGTLEPPIEIAFDTGDRATPFPGSIQHDGVSNSHRAPADYADFLASPSAFRECIQGVDTTRVRKSRFNAITGRVSAARGCRIGRVAESTGEPL